MPAQIIDQSFRPVHDYSDEASKSFDRATTLQATLQSETQRNQLLQQQIGIQSAQQQNEAQLNQARIQSIQQQTHLASLMEPSELQNSRQNAQIGAANLAHLPALLANQDQSATDAHNLSMAQMAVAGLQKDQMSALAPFYKEMAQNKMDQDKMNLVHLTLTNEQLDPESSINKANQTEQQKQFVVQNWDKLAPDTRGQFKAVYPDDEIIQALPTDESNPIKAMAQAIGKGMNSSDPETKQRSMKYAAQLLSAQSGIPPEKVNPLAALSGQKTQETPEQNVEALINRLPASGATSGPAAIGSGEVGGSTDEQAFSTTKTGIPQIDAALYHASQNPDQANLSTSDVGSKSEMQQSNFQKFMNKSPSGGGVKNGMLDFGNDFQKHLEQTYGAEFKAYPGPEGGMGEVQTTPEYRAFQRALVPASDATGGQHVVYNALVRKIGDGDLQSSSGYKAAVAAFNTTVKTNPKALSPQQKSRLTELFQDFKP